MRRLALFAATAVVGAACAAPNGLPVSTTDGTATPTPPSTAATPDRGMVDDSSAGVAADAIVADDRFVVTTDGNLTVVSLPGFAALECVNVTASPIWVDGLVVYPLYTKARQCDGDTTPWSLLIGYDPESGEARVLADGAQGEATLVYDEASGVVWWDTVNGLGPVVALDAATFQVRGVARLRTSNDSAGVVFDGLYRTGMVNTPQPSCQGEPNLDCGIVVTVAVDGTIVDRLDVEDGFRSWVGASITTDGESLYVGGGKSELGDELSGSAFGCAAMRLSPDLDVLASFDPGDPGCHYLDFVGANADAVAGEMVPTGDGVWVPYPRPNAEENVTRLWRLNEDLEPICSVGFPFISRWQTVGFYASVTVDAGGDAYLALTLPGDTPVAALYRITPGCDATELHRVDDAQGLASPTLADDTYVLFATDGLLTVLTVEGDVVAEYPLGSPARVMGSPMVRDGVVYVLQEDGTLNVIADTGFEGYGNAIWPRYRHDDAGTGNLTTPTGR